MGTVDAKIKWKNLKFWKNVKWPWNKPKISKELTPMALAKPNADVTDVMKNSFLRSFKYLFEIMEKRIIALGSNIRSNSHV